MVRPIFQFVSTKRPFIDYREMERVRPRVLPVDASEHRYLRVIQTCLNEMKSAPGLIVLEQDIAIDPMIMAEMDYAINTDPGRVVTVPYALWPASTGKQEPEWSIGFNSDEGKRLAIPYPMQIPMYVRWFALGCTWLPRKLLEAAPDTEQSWDYPMLACRLSELAQRLDIDCYVVRPIALHMHW